MFKSHVKIPLTLREKYFQKEVGPVKPSGGGTETANVKDKANTVDAVTLHDLDGPSNADVARNRLATA